MLLILFARLAPEMVRSTSQTVLSAHVMVSVDAGAAIEKSFLFASPRFWICNLSAWLVFAATQIARSTLDGHSFNALLGEFLPIAALGVAFGLLIHRVYHKRGWQSLHPLQLIPVAGVAAVVFALVSVVLCKFELVMALPEICARETPRPPYPCGALTDLYLRSMNAMLMWCLLYFGVQSERKIKPQAKLGHRSIWMCNGLLWLVLLNQLGIFLTVIAFLEWGDTYYLFSRAYAIDALTNLLPIIPATYILFVQRRWIFLKSKILPLVPLMVTVAFACTALGIGIAGGLSRMAYLDMGADFYYVFFGSRYGGYTNPAQLAGSIEGGLVNHLSMAFFFLYNRNYHHRDAFGAEVAGGQKAVEVGISVPGGPFFLSLLFWGVFGLLIYGADLMELRSLGPSVPWVSSLSCVLVGTFLGVMLYLQVGRFVAHSESGVSLTMRIAVASIFAGLLLAYSIWLINYAYILIMMEGDGLEQYAEFVNDRNYVFSSILSAVVLSGLWCFVCFMMESLTRLRASAALQLKMERNMRDFQLSALAGRVDPHFVFNALNNIRALVKEDSEKARFAITALADILRGPITANSQDKVTIAEEMELVRQYIALSKIQYETRIRYSEQIDEHACQALIPAMMLQILVENAIKHGISRLENGGELLVDIYKKKPNVVCVVRNHGSLKSSSALGFGVGLTTLRERLALLYGGSATFNLSEVGGYVHAELVLPDEPQPHIKPPPVTGFRKQHHEI